MTGSILYRRAVDPPDAYARAVIAFDDGSELRYADLRKLGQMWLSTAGGGNRGLGPEPLDDALLPRAARIQARRAPIKAVLLTSSHRGPANLHR
jgi:formamidopyrimidine-DNA glycosylase